MLYEFLSSEVVNGTAGYDDLGFFIRLPFSSMIPFLYASVLLNGVTKSLINLYVTNKSIALPIRFSLVRLEPLHLILPQLVHHL